MVTVVNAGYRSTNYWVISARTSHGTNRLLVDLGWPGRAGALLANLRRLGVPLDEIRYGVATHYHIDHAGAAQDLKEAGVPLLVLEQQVSAIPLMKRHTKPADNYNEITPDGNIVIACADSRRVLKEIGIDGEIVPTPGHSPDSVTVVLDNGSVFTGDLPTPDRAAPHEAEQVAASWQLLRDLGATTVYPGHGPARPLPAVSPGM